MGILHLRCAIIIAVLLHYLCLASSLVLPIHSPISGYNILPSSINGNVSAPNTLTVEQNIRNLLRLLAASPFPGAKQAKLVSILLRVDDHDTIIPTLSSDIASFRKIDCGFRWSDPRIIPPGFSIENRWPTHWDHWEAPIPERVSEDWAPVSWQLLFSRMSVEWADVVLKRHGYRGPYGAIVLQQQAGAALGWCFEHVQLDEHWSGNVLVEPNGVAQRWGECAVDDLSPTRQKPVRNPIKRKKC